jgi:mRNA interferase HigB
MRVITQTRLKQAIEKYPQWRFGIQLWLEVFKQKTINFESYQQIKQIWKEASGWNVDRVPTRKVADAVFKGHFDIYVFDIHKNKCRIVTRIQASTNKIFIRGVYSHAEYDKWWKTSVNS